MNSPEWITILIGCIACLMSGMAHPIFAVILAKIIHVTNVFLWIFYQIIDIVLLYLFFRPSTIV
jgi:hypothetical protein